MHYVTASKQKQRQTLRKLSFCHLQFTALSVHTECRFIKCKCHSWRKKMGIYVCASDGKRKPFAPSGDTQGQRGIDGVNSEWQGAETQLCLFVCVLAFSLSFFFSCFLSLFNYLTPLAF